MEGANNKLEEHAKTADKERLANLRLRSASWAPSRMSKRNLSPTSCTLCLWSLTFSVLPVNARASGLPREELEALRKQKKLWDKQSAIGLVGQAASKACILQ